LMQRRTSQIAVMAVCAGVAAIAITVPQERSLLRRPIVSRNQYAATLWAHDHLKPVDVGLAVPGLDGYHLWWSTLRRPAPDPNVLSDVPRVTVWDTWPSETSQRYLVTSGSMANRFLGQTGVTITYQRGDAYVLDRGK
jgi:hypothetical protein